MRHLPVTTKNYSTTVSTAATLHSSMPLPNGDYFEVDQDPNELEYRSCRCPSYRIEDGMAAPAGDRPGLGIDVAKRR